MNSHFGGTYEAYLAFESHDMDETPQAYASGLGQRLEAWVDQLSTTDPAAVQVADTMRQIADTQLGQAVSAKDLLATILKSSQARARAASGAVAVTWDDALTFLDTEAQRGEIFKQPAVLRYLSELQQAVLATQVVGKSNSVADLVKTVHRELLLGESSQFRIPDSVNAVAQCLMTFQNSHRPNDLWHFVTPDYRKANIWLQLRSGDNKDMERVVAFVDTYIKTNPPPVALQHEWFGLTYINVVWQDKIVSGMLHAFLGSFVVVFVMMTILFRSVLWGFLCMIPLSITISSIYGVIGFMGKDYDMPVAVLSSLTLGLAVDFAIHFLARTRELVARSGSWQTAIGEVFGAPARAIVRNVVVIVVGFLPLLAAPLVPYKTVGFFLAAIMAVSGIGTLIILPALVRVFQSHLFGEQQHEHGWLWQTAQER